MFTKLYEKLYAISEKIFKIATPMTLTLASIIFLIVLVTLLSVNEIRYRLSLEEELIIPETNPETNVVLIVKDTRNEPIENAEIIVTYKLQKDSKKLYTDSNGYVIFKITKGLNNIIIEARKEGFINVKIGEPCEENVCSKTTTVRVNLEEKNL